MCIFAYVYVCMFSESAALKDIQKNVSRENPIPCGILGDLIVYFYTLFCEDSSRACVQFFKWPIPSLIFSSVLSVNVLRITSLWCEELSGNRNFD